MSHFRTRPVGLYDERIRQVSEQSNKNTRVNCAYKKNVYVRHFEFDRVTFALIRGIYILIQKKLSMCKRRSF